MNQQASAFNAVCAASYLDDYLECVETLPGDVQRYITKLRQLDSLYFDSIGKLNQLKDNYIETCKGIRENPLNDSLKIKKIEIIANIKSTLLYGQTISDEQLKHISIIEELLEVKSRKLEQESRNLDPSISANLFKQTSSANTNSTNVSQSSGTKGAAAGPVASGKNDTTSSFLPAKCDVKQNGTAHAVAVAQTANGEESETSTSHSRAPSSVPSQSTAPHSKQIQKLTTSNRRPKRSRLNHDCARKNSDTALSDLPTSTSYNSRGLLTSSNKDKDCPAVDQQRDTISSALGNANNKSSTESSRERTPVVVVPNKKQRRRQGGDKDRDDSAPLLKSSKMKYNVPVDPDEPTYCLCEQVSYGEMIGCDNSDCIIEWYHFNCVGLASKPKGKWYCPNCRGDRPNVMKD